LYSSVGQLTTLFEPLRAAVSLLVFCGPVKYAVFSPTGVLLAPENPSRFRGCVLNVCDLSWELFNGKWVAVDRYAYGFFAWRHVWGMQMVDRGGDGLPGSSHSVPGHRKTKIEQIPDKLEFGLVFLFGFFFQLFRTFLVPAKFSRIFLVFLFATFFWELSAIVSTRFRLKYALGHYDYFYIARSSC